MLSWQYALAAAGGLVIAATAIRAGRRAGRPAGRWAAWALWDGVAWESALLFGLYALWQFAGSFTVMGTSGALPRARWLWHAERVLYLPSETALQRPFLPHPVLVQACNLYYDILHFPLLGACLVWLYARHRESYPRVRTTVALFTGVSLLIQLIPVAPAGRGVPGAHAARRRGDSQSFLGRRNCRRAAGGPGPGGAADGGWATF